MHHRCPAAGCKPAFKFSPESVLPAVLTIHTAQTKHRSTTLFTNSYQKQTGLVERRRSTLSRVRMRCSRPKDRTFSQYFLPFHNCDTLLVRSSKLRSALSLRRTCILMLHRRPLHSLSKQPFGTLRTRLIIPTRRCAAMLQDNVQDACC